MVSAIAHRIFEPYADQDDCWGCGQPYEYGKFGLLCFYCGELYELRNPSPPALSMPAGFSRYWAGEAIPMRNVAGQVAQLCLTCDAQLSPASPNALE